MIEFDQFKNDAGHNYSTLSPKKWIDGVNAIDIISEVGKCNGGTYAHKDCSSIYVLDFTQNQFIHYQRVSASESR